MLQDTLRQKISQLISSHPDGLKVLQEFVPPPPPSVYSYTPTFPDPSPSPPVASPTPDVPPTPISPISTSAPSSDNVLPSSGDDDAMRVKLIDKLTNCLSANDLDGCAQVWEEMDQKVKGAKAEMYIKMVCCASYAR